MFLNTSTCFGRHTAYHQELKTVIAASGFTYVFGCGPLRWLSRRSSQQQKNILILITSAAAAAAATSNAWEQ
jgi:hypothetical protein